MIYLLTGVRRIFQLVSAATIWLLSFLWEILTFLFLLSVFLIKRTLVLFFIVTFFSIIVASYLAFTHADNIEKVFSADLVTPSKIMGHNNTGMIFYDRNGGVIFQESGARESTKPLPLMEIPKSLIEATIAIEDKDFYEHKGISITGVARALLSNFQEKDPYGQGASTITQQLARNALLSLDKSYERKFKEIVLAMEIEKDYNKDQILEMYLNSIYYGAGAYGIRDAAKIYFNKEAKDLTLAESTMLAALPFSPTALSPLGGDREAVKSRQGTVLDRMVKYGYLKEEEAEAAKSQELVYAPKKEILRYPHFVEYVRSFLQQKYGLGEAEKQGFKIYTTIDPSLQELGETVIQNRVNDLQNYHVTNGALLAVNPKTGEILSMVGSVDYNQPGFGSFNVLTGFRSPGSSIKPVMYAGAFEKGLTAGSILNDSPKTINIFGEIYQPKDSDGRFRGKVTVRRALSNSLNVPAVEVGQMLGIPSVLETFKKFGLTDLGGPNQYGPSIAVGGLELHPIELVGAFATLANEGKRVEPAAILRIENKYGEVIYEHQKKTEQVVDPRIAYILSDILSDNPTRREIFGYPNALELSRRAAVKTGTGEDFKNDWTLGYTPSLAIGIWMGNNDGSPTRSVWGSTGAAYVWHAFMEQALGSKPDEWFIRPDGIVEATVCDTGKKELFIVGTEPKPCPARPAPQPTTPAKKT
ncbi:MAG: PBP1A family penicillin-binding protein [Patescibacteria group bacterium]|nr:PBP1A family penicillin-binding protein [Patescibacteria group bacterium]